MSSLNNKKTAALFVTAPPQEVKLRKLTTRPMSQFEERDQRWLWRPFIPLGTVTSMFGDVGVGKSTVTYDLIARLTTKRPMPNRTKGVSGSVLFMASEDAVETTIKPRLRAAGADMDRVYALGYDDPEDPENFDPVEAIGDHLKDLEQIIEEHGDVRLLVIDPIADFAGDLNLDKNQDVRRLLRPLIKLARKHELAAIIIFHINKNPEQSAKHRGMGSLAMRNVPRSSLLMAVDPISPVTRRVLVQTKTNVGRADNTAIGFEIVETRGGKVIRIEWDTEMSDADPDELLSKKAAKETQHSKAIKFLHDQLEHGPVDAVELRDLAKDHNLSWTTLKRVKEEAGAISRKNAEGVWRWQLKKKQGKGTKNQSLLVH